MDQRLDLHKVLTETLGTNHVYYSPPASVRMQYPAIVYSLSSINAQDADNIHYLQRVTYSVTLIDYDVDSKFIKKILAIPKCTFDRSYASDNLNHFVFTITINSRRNHAQT